MSKFFAAHQRFFALRATIGFVAAGLLLTVLGLFTTNSHLVIPHFDQAIGNWVRSFATPALTTVFRFASRLGSTFGLTAIGIVIIGIFLYMRRLKYIGLLLLIMIGQVILQYGFKIIFERQRPEAMFDYVVGDTPSFPSGHALAAMCFFGLLAYLMSLNLRSSVHRAGVWAIAITLILFIGLSRIYFDVHYPSDVLAGYLAGVIWTTSVASGANP